MLFSEEQERGNRFRLALKIGFPFLFIIFIFIILRFNSLSNEDVILLSMLSIIYTYYIFFQIYTGFKSTIIDPITKTFNNSTIMSIYDEWKENRYKSLAVMICVSNIADINERYGLNYGDKILKNFIKELQKFLEKNNLKKTPIGRYGGGYFLFFIDLKSSKEFEHTLRIFEKQLKEKLETEIKVEFSTLSMDYDEKKENVILELIERINPQKDRVTSIKPDAFDKLVSEGIKRQDFSFRYQPLLSVRNEKVEIYEVLTKLHSTEYGALPKSQINSVINRNGFEVDFDKAFFEKFISEIKHNSLDVKYLIEFSPISLRNQKFIQFLKDFIEKNKIDASCFIIEFGEKKPYDEIQRFVEIIKEYKDMGFGICLKQFGGKNASLEYLKHLPIDFINFDIEYTKNIKKENFNIILHSYIELFKSLHVKSIVKFIDKKELFELVKEMNVDYIQGHFVGKPQNLKNMETK